MAATRCCMACCARPRPSSQRPTRRYASCRARLCNRPHACTVLRMISRACMRRAGALHAAPRLHARAPDRGGAKDAQAQCKALSAVRARTPPPGRSDPHCWAVLHGGHIALLARLCSHANVTTPVCSHTSSPAHALLIAPAVHACPLPIAASRRNDELLLQRHFQELEWDRAKRTFVREVLRESKDKRQIAVLQSRNPATMRRSVEW